MHFQLNDVESKIVLENIKYAIIIVFVSIKLNLIIII